MPTTKYPFGVTRLAMTPALMILLAASCTAQPAQVPSLARAAELLQQQKPEEAESLLRQLVKAEPGGAVAWNLLGAALDSQNKCQPAEEAYQRAARLSPAAVAVWNNLGNHYLACGNPSGARDAFRKVLSLAPAQANANLQLARIALDRKEGAEALRRLDRLDGGERAEPGVALLRARALFLTGSKSEALAALELLEKQVKGPAAWHSLGLAWAECGEFGRAEELFSRALEADPANLDILHNLGVAALRAGHPRRAQEVLEAALRLRPGDPALLLQLERARAAQPTILTEPAQASGLIENAQNSMRSGKTGQALEFLRRAAAANPSPDERLDLVMILAQASGPEPAMRELEKVHPEERTGDYYLVKAQVLDWIGDSKAAAENLNLCLASAPKRPDLFRSAALFLIKEGKTRAAADVLDRATLAIPDDRDLQLLRSVALTLLSRLEESHELLDRISARWPDWSRPYLVRGIVEQSQYRDDDALKSIQAAFDLGERGPEAEFYLGLILLRARPESMDRALEAAQRAVQTRPDDPWARILAGRILKQSGRTDHAIRCFKEAVELQPKLAQAHYWLGSTYIAMGRTTQGQQEMAEVDRLRERNPAAVDSEDWGIREKLFLLSQ
jgi:Flp pilus assembly protein TadD